MRASRVMLRYVDRGYLRVSVELVCRTRAQLDRLKEIVQRAEHAGRWVEVATEADDGTDAA